MPDRAAADAKAPIVSGYMTMDRGALLGSYIHRDIGWITHFFAAFAVLAAVAGHLTHALAWGIIELIVLAFIAGMVWAMRRTDLQDRWTACRMGAEQLRIARMVMPLLVLPRALATSDKAPANRGHHGPPGELEFAFRALAEVKRAVRMQGLPKTAEAFTPDQAAAWLRLIVADQVTYHRNNHIKLERAEERVRRLTEGLFFIAFAFVVTHVVLHLYHYDAPWLLLGTAAGPAFAAALHGAGIRMGIVHRAALSHEVERELREVEKGLDALPSAPEEAWIKVRRLAYEAAEKMGAENTSWHGLVRRYRDELV